MAVAWLAMGLVSRTHAQTAVSNNIVSANLNGAASFAMPTTTFGGAVTLEGWVYPVSHANWQRIVDIGNVAGSDMVFLASSYQNNGRPVLSFYSGSTLVTELVSPTAIPLSTWTHVAGVIGSDQSVRLYVNGQLVASGTASGLPRTVARTSGLIGKSNSSFDALLNGAVADVRIWNTGRTQSQITNSMPVGSITGPTTGLVAAYPFAATGETALADVSGNGYTLTQSGTVGFSKFMSGTLVTAGFRGSTYVGVAGGSLVITGANNDYSLATVVSSGATYALRDSGALPNSSAIMVAGGGTFDVSGRSSTLALGSSQTLTNTSANASVTGNLDVSLANLGLLSNGSTPAFTVSGGTLTVGADTALLLNNSGTALAAGAYKVVAKGTGGAVAGTAPRAVVVTGGGMASGMAATAEISGGELFVRVAAPQLVTSAENLIGANISNGNASFLMPTTTFGGPVTLEAWVYPFSNAGWARMMDIGNGAGVDNVLLSMFSTTGCPHFVVYSGTTQTGNITSPTALPLNAWSHVAGVIASDLSMRLYVNGQLVASGTASALPRTIARTLGRLAKDNWGGTVDGFLNGVLSDCRIWTVARTQAQILANMPVGSITGPTSGLFAAYPFGSTGGAVLADISGNALNLTQVGSPRYEKAFSGSLITSDVQGSATVGVSGGRLTLGGTNSYTGATVVTAGTLALSGSGGLPGSPTITVAGGGTFDVSGLSTPLTLGASQTLTNSSANAFLIGNLDASVATLGLLSNGSTPAFTVSGGTLTVGPDTVLRLNNTGTALAAGSYKVVAKGSGGAVAGLPPGAVVVTGSGIASGMVLSAQVSGDELYVKVSPPQLLSTSDRAMAVNLNGTSSSFSMPTTTFGGAVTLEGWVNPVSHASWQRIVDIGNGQAADNVVLAASWETSGRPIMSFYSGNTLIADLTSPTAIPLNTWTHVAGVFGSDLIMRLYVNGQLVASRTTPSLPRTLARSSGLIGKSNWTDWLLNGALADVRVWSVARTQAQIGANMPVGSISGPTNGLVAAYPFGSTGSSVLADVAGSALNLTEAGTVRYEKLGTNVISTTLEDLAIRFYRYYRLVPTLLKGGATADAVQLSEFQMLWAGNRLGGATATNPGGSNAGFPPSQASDNNLTTKWFDSTKTNPLVLDFGVPVRADAYRLGTANDMPGRDPVSWRVEASNDNSTWLVLDTETNYPTTDSRNTYTPSIALNPGAVVAGSPSTVTVTAGTLALTGNNTFTGGIAVNGGTFSIGNGGDTGTPGSGPIVNSSSVVFNRSGPLLVTNLISGFGTVTQSGPGTTILTATNTYTGLTTIMAGTLQVGNGSTNGTLGSANVVNHGTLAFNRSDTVTYSNVVSGTGALLKDGAGTLVLVATNSYDGATTVAAGRLQVGAGGTAGTLGGGAITNQGTLAWRRSDAVTVPNAISGSGALVHEGSGTLTLTGTNTYSGTTTANAGNLRVGDGGSTGTLGLGAVSVSGNLAIQRSGEFTIPGAISGTASLTHSGPGTVILSGANTYSGVTTVAAGTLQVGDGGNSGTLGSANVVNNGTLAFNRGDALAVGNVISGSGALVKAGTGTLTLSASNTFTGPTTVSGGTLTLSATGTLGGTPGVTLANSTVLDVSARPSGLSLASGQGLSVSSGTATLRGNVAAGSGRLSVIAGVTPPLRIASGNLALSAGTTVEVLAAGTPLGVGTYKLVAADAGGAVTGIPPMPSIAGAGLASGMQSALAIVSGELVVQVRQTVVITLGNLSQAYDGSPKVPSVTTLPANAPVVFTYNGSTTAPTEPGSYAVVATVANADTQAGTATGTLVIAKKQATVTVASLVYTYDGTQPRVSATTDPANLKLVFTFDGKPTVPVYVGRYAIVATVDDPYYEGTGTGRLTVLAGNAGKGPAPNPLPPGFLTYQGMLIDSAGVPLNPTNPANARLVFRLYDSPTGGAPLWGEEQVAMVDAGQFSVVLGEGNVTGRDPWPPLLTVFTSGTTSRRYLQVTAIGKGPDGGDLTILPRVLLPPVPYAFLAKHAVTAERLANSSNQTVLSVSGPYAGILQPAPAATLDVGGDMVATRIKATGTGRVGGTLKASKVNGRGFIPVGGIVPWSGTAVPAGWVLCDGRTTNSIQTPDLRARFVMGGGTGQGLSPREVGQVGGAEQFTLTLSQMPQHRHVIDPAPMEIVSSGTHDHSYESGWGFSIVGSDQLPYNPADTEINRRRVAGINATANSTSTGGSHTHEVTLGTMETTFTGEGQPFGVMPPYYVLAYIMRIQ